MGLFNFMKREVRSNDETTQTTTPQISTSPFSDALLFGTRFSEKKAMSLSAVFRAVDLISDSVAVLPIRVKDKNSTNHNLVIEKHPIYNLFDNKNNLLTKYNFIKRLVQSVLLKGNGFAFVERNGDGSPKSLRFLEANDVTIVYHKEKNELYYLAPIVSKKHIEPINMIHLIKNTYDGVNGISVISFANKTIGIATHAEDAANSYFENGCNLSGVLTVQGQLNEQQKQAIRNSWSSAYSNGGSGLAVIQGNMSYQAIQMSASDAQLLESREFNVSDVARWFGLNPVLLGDNSGTSYNTIDSAQQEFVLHTLIPYVTMIEEEFSKKLLKTTESDFLVTLDETYLLRSDKQNQASYYNTLLSTGVLCINEVRKELGYGEIEGGDKHLIAYTDIEQNTINKPNENE